MTTVEGTQIIPFKQVSPGDALEPVQEWTAQFEGTVTLGKALVDSFIDNTDTADIEHGLERPIFGAVVLGVMNDFSVTGLGFAYVIAIESSTNKTFNIVFSKVVNGTMRFLVF